MWTWKNRLSKEQFVVSEMKLGKAIVGTQHTAEHTWPSSPACDPLFFSPAVSRDPDSSGSFFKILTNRF